MKERINQLRTILNSLPKTSKMALATILLIVAAAIPLTVVAAQQSQNYIQQASTSCKPGQERCIGNSAQTCAITGRWGIAKECPPGYRCTYVGTKPGGQTDVSCLKANPAPTYYPPYSGIPTPNPTPTPPPASNPTPTPTPTFKPTATPTTAPKTFNPATYYCNIGGATGYSYKNTGTGVCTNGTYTSFYHSPTCTATSANLGTSVLIQPCNYVYYSSQGCTGSIVGYHRCTSRTVTSN